MKKNALFIIILILSVSFLSAQKSKDFTGILTVSINYEGDWDAATLAQQPKQMTVTIANNKTKSSMLVSGASIATIANGNDLSQIVLINAMGMKIYVKSTKDEIIGDMEKEPVIRYLDETKIIADFNAKKAEYIVEDEFGDEKMTIVYFSEEIGNENLNFGGQFHGLKGFPLEYQISTDEGIVTFTTTKVERKKKIKDTEFMIPDDYEQMSREALRGMGG